MSTQYLQKIIIIIIIIIYALSWLILNREGVEIERESHIWNRISISAPTLPLFVVMSDTTTYNLKPNLNEPTKKCQISQTIGWVKIKAGRNVH